MHAQDARGRRRLLRLNCCRTMLFLHCTCSQLYLAFFPASAFASWRPPVPGQRCLFTLTICPVEIHSRKSKQKLKAPARCPVHRHIRAVCAAHFQQGEELRHQTLNHKRAMAQWGVRPSRHRAASLLRVRFPVKVVLMRLFVAPHFLGSDSRKWGVSFCPFFFFFLCFWQISALQMSLTETNEATPLQPT